MLDTVNRSKEPDYMALTAEIVAAYVSRNSLPAGELPDLLRAVHDRLQSIVFAPTDEPTQEPPKPAVPVKKSVHQDYIVCLESGKRFKSLKRHLATAYGLTPDQYRTKWDLPKDYPMVAPAYASTRSTLARQMGLGRKTGGGDVEARSGSVAEPNSPAVPASEPEAERPHPARRRGKAAAEG